MSEPTEQSRRHQKDGRVSVVTQRNSRRAFRHEVCDKLGEYLSTFVTGTDRWEIGNSFTTGDGRTFRITGISAPGQSGDRPAFTDRWTVEPSA